MSRTPVKLLGLDVGTCSGFDGYGDANGIIFYEIEASKILREKIAGLPLFLFNLSFDPESGLIEILDNDWDVLSNHQLVFAVQ